MSKETSTLEYLSNIQIVDTSKAADTSYMAFVHDPFALEEMEKLIEIGRIQYNMTPLQRREMRDASKHCSYAFVDDYPWGTVEINGEKKVVCKCINLDCSRFSICRNGLSAFDESELIVEKQTKIVSNKTENISEGEEFKRELIYSLNKMSESDAEEVYLKQVEERPEESYYVVHGFDFIDIEINEQCKTLYKTCIPEIIREKIEFLGTQEKSVNTIFGNNISGKENDIVVYLQEKFLDKTVDFLYLPLKEIEKIQKYVTFLAQRFNHVPSILFLASKGWFTDSHVKNYYDRVDRYDEKDLDQSELFHNCFPKVYWCIKAVENGCTQIIEDLIFLCDTIGKAPAVEDRSFFITLKESLERMNDLMQGKNASLVTSAGIQDDFKAWLISENINDPIANAYIKSIDSTNIIANKKAIWNTDIWTCKVSDEVNEQIEKLQKSVLFRASMSNSIIALKQFSTYLGAQESRISDEIVKRTISSGDGLFEGEGFEKFVEAEQDVVIFSEPNERIVVNAGPGTGKTYTLIEKLIYMVNDQEVDPEEILVLCFSRAAVEVVENRLHQAYEEGRIGMNWHSIDIRTFDSFATHLLSYVIENESELLYSGFSLDSLDYDGRIVAATEVIKKSSELIEQCSHLVVDEVQDLVSVRAMFVKQLIISLSNESGYTLLGDACQSIYDYQIQNGEIDSAQFYSWIFETQTQAKFYEFTINHRQTSELENLGNNYRSEILMGDDATRNCASNLIYESVDELIEIDLKSAEVDEILNLTGGKRLGILTRTNGQALKISTWFRNAGIPHKVQKRLTENSLNVWIADVFRDYENNTIDKEAFEVAYIEKGYFENDPDVIWSCIEKTQYEAQNRYYVRDILYGILNNGKTKEFYNSIGDEQVVISNIHRSKGREFDQVILLDDILMISDDEKKDILEHKVSYVAITRAKEKIYRTNIGKQFVKTDKKGDRRAYALGNNIRQKKPRLSHIEIGRAYDIDPVSFAENESIQAIFDIPETIIGERVILVKNKEQSKMLGYISYDIFMEDDVSAGIVGRTSKKFYLDLNRILKDVYGIYNGEPYEGLFPERFSDIYIDDVISVISTITPMAKYCGKYNDMMVWKGITLVGFAQVERDTY